MDSAVLEVLLKAKDEISGVAKKASDSLAGIGKVAALAGGAVAIGLAGAAAGLFKLGNDFDSAYDKIQTTTGATGAELAELSGNFKDVFGSIPTDMESASTAVADFAQKTGATGDTLESLSKSAIYLSDLTGTDLAGNIDAVSKVMNNWGLSTEEGTELMDDLFIAAQKTGTGIDVITAATTKFGPALRELGFGLEDSIALVANFEKNGIDANAAIGGLRKAVVNFAKDGKSASEGVAATFDAIANAKDSTEATAKAIEVFGAKAGPELAEAIRTGQFSIGELQLAMAESDGAIVEAAESTADFGEKFQILKNKAMLALEPLALKTLEIATTIAERAIPVVEKLAEVFAVVIPVAIAAIGTAWDTYGPLLIAGFQSFADIVQTKIIPPLEMLVNFFRENESAAQALAVGVGTVLAVAFLLLAVNAGIAAVAMVVAAAPVIALVAAIALLGAGIFLLIKHWDAIVAKVPALGVAFEGVRRVAQVAMDAIEQILEGLRQYIEGYLKVLEGLFKVFTGILTGDWQQVWEGLRQIVDGAKDMIQGAFKAATAVWMSVWKNFDNEIKAGAKATVDGIFNAIQALPGQILTLLGAMDDAGRQFAMALMKGVGEGLGNAGGFASDLASKVVSALKSAVNAAVIDPLNRVELKLSIPHAPDITVPFPNIPRLAMGGIVTGPTLALLGDNASRREMVVPLERASEMGFSKGGNQTYAIYPPPGFGWDDDAYAKRLIDTLRRAGANI